MTLAGERGFYQRWPQLLFEKGDVGHGVRPLSGCELIVGIKPLESR